MSVVTLNNIQKTRHVRVKRRRLSNSFRKTERTNYNKENVQKVYNNIVNQEEKDINNAIKAIKNIIK